MKVDGLPEKPLDWLSDENAIDDGGANYKIAPDGRPRFFEINPRFGGSLLQRKQKAELREAIGRAFGLDPKDPIEVSYQRPFPGDPDLKDPAVRSKLKLDWSHGHNMALVNGVGRIGWMKGGKAALWNDETMGDTFCDKNHPLTIEKPKFPAALYRVALTPKTQADAAKITPTLTRLCEEDMTLVWQNDQITHETVLQGMGDQHIDVAVHRAQTKFQHRRHGAQDSAMHRMDFRYT